MPQILFLLHCLAITGMYTLIRFFHLKELNISTLEIAGYMNIWCLVVFIPYFFKNLKIIIKSFKRSLNLSTSVISSAFKMIAISDVSPKNTIAISFLQPVFIVIFSFLFLGEYDKKSKKNLLFITLSLIGAFVFIGGFEITSHKLAYLFVFIHILLKAATSIFIKKNTSKDKYITFFYLTFFYAVFGIFIIGRNFNLAILFNPYIIIIFLVNMFSQLTIINSYKLTDKISSLQHLDYSKVIFGLITTAFILQEPVLLRQVVGTFIIISSIIFSNFKNIKKFYFQRNK